MSSHSIPDGTVIICGTVCSVQTPSLVCKKQRKKAMFFLLASSPLCLSWWLLLVNAPPPRHGAVSGVSAVPQRDRDSEKPKIKAPTNLVPGEEQQVCA